MPFVARICDSFVPHCEFMTFRCYIFCFCNGGSLERICSVRTGTIVQKGELTTCRFSFLEENMCRLDLPRSEDTRCLAIRNSLSFFHIINGIHTVLSDVTC